MSKPRKGGSAPKEVQEHGEMFIGVTYDGYVCVTFHDPDWWMHLTPDEAIEMAENLLKYAKQATAENN